MVIQLASIDISYLLNIGGPLIALATWIHYFDSATLIHLTGWCRHASYLSFFSNYILNMSISYRRSADTKELWSSNSFQSSCIGGPPIPGNYRHQIQFNHLVSASRQCQGTMVIKFILVISYRRAADTRKLWASNSFSSSRIGGPPIPGSYGSQVHLPHLVSAGRQYQGTMFIKLIYLISYRRAANTRELCSSN